MFVSLCVCVGMCGVSEHFCGYAIQVHMHARLEVL